MLVTLLCATATAFTVPHLPAAVAPPRATVPSAMLLDLPFNLLAEVVDGSGERVYGAVDAPDWVIPVGGLLAILTALLPVLLAPGEEAFTRQQGDEQKVANQFGRDRRK